MFCLPAQKSIPASLSPSPAKILTAPRFRQHIWIPKRRGLLATYRLCGSSFSFYPSDVRIYSTAFMWENENVATIPHSPLSKILVIQSHPVPANTPPSFHPPPRFSALSARSECAMRQKKLSRLRDIDGWSWRCASKPNKKGFFLFIPLAIGIKGSCYELLAGLQKRSYCHQVSVIIMVL